MEAPETHMRVPHLLQHLEQISIIQDLGCCLESSCAGGALKKSISYSLAETVSPSF